MDFKEKLVYLRYDLWQKSPIFIVILAMFRSTFADELAHGGQSACMGTEKSKA